MSQRTIHELYQGLSDKHGSKWATNLEERIIDGATGCFIDRQKKQTIQKMEQMKKLYLTINAYTM